MKKWLIALSGVVIAIIAFLVLRPSSTVPGTEAIGAENPSGTKSSNATRQLDETRLPVPTDLDGTNEELAAEAKQQEHDRILDEIHEASIQYEPAQIPVITPYLTHPEKEVRQAAIDGLIVLGESAASVHLRDAAKQMEDPRDAVLFLEAADYLELPPGRLRLKKKD